MTLTLSGRPWKSTAREGVINRMISRRKIWYKEGMVGRYLRLCVCVCVCARSGM